MDHPLTEQQIKDRNKWKRYYENHKDVRLVQMKEYDRANHERRMELQRLRRATRRVPV